MGKSLKMNYIDLHTHSLKHSGATEVLNIFAQDFDAQNRDYVYSVGFHPWHINNFNWEECFRLIGESASEKNMLFVGECGLDRHIDTAFALQEDCFMRQVQIADYCRKPLIIHNVRTHNDLIRIKKQMKSSVPWILHGYYGNLESTLSLVRNGFYFSVGEKLIHDKRKAEVLKRIPMNSLFFETDESSITIEQLYKDAAVALKKSEDELISLVWGNFENVSKNLF
jgi:Mg-dependent DNase